MLSLRALSRLALVSAALVSLPLAAVASPLGLQNGDLVSSLEWDALQSVPGDGGQFTTTGVNTGDTTMDGRITSVTIQGPTSNPISDTNFQLNATLSAVNLVPNFPAPGLTLASLTFTGVAGDDIVLTDGSGTILTAELDASGLLVGGVYDLSGTLVDANAIANAVDITITGGDADLVNALGAAGKLDLDGTLFDFSPGIASILANLQIDENFSYSGSGVIQPTAASPFVPEPSTALMVLLGLGGLKRAAARRRA
ncbi:MAG: PEP-CTERM sorting domain-containing protein [Myxococcota bacterium]